MESGELLVSEAPQPTPLLFIVDDEECVASPTKHRFCCLADGTPFLSTKVQLISPDTLIKSMRFLQQRWDSFHEELVGSHRESCVATLQTLYDAGLTHIPLLRSISALTKEDIPDHADSMFLAHFLSVGRSKPQIKRQVVWAILSCLHPDDICDVHDERVQKTLDSLTTRSLDASTMDACLSCSLLWELRAMCLRLLDLQKQRLDVMLHVGDTAALLISAGAKWLENGMTKSIPLVSSQMQVAAKQAKGTIRPAQYPLMMDRDAVVATVFSDALKRASQGLLDSTEWVVLGIRDATSQGVETLAGHWDGDKMGDAVPVEGLVAVQALGKVGMATVGAVVVVGEAVLDSSRALLQAATQVTAEVVEHKYGSSAGQVVSDAGETAVNIYKTIGHVALLAEGASMAKSVAKKTAKSQVSKESDRAKEWTNRMDGQVAALLDRAGRPVLGQRTSKGNLLGGSALASRKTVQTIGTTSDTTAHDNPSLPRTCSLASAERDAALSDETSGNFSCPRRSISDSILFKTTG
eukprot:Nitzschia sp. Nitz4//scaffold29_size155292//53450//55018//NITZ4_002651-RA/size155292-processed-gene-0.284-mRNA-1//-1//CDS//3329546427//2011//frame0